MMDTIGWLLIALVVVICGGIWLLRQLASADRIDSPEDMAAREKMFDDVERRFWKRESLRNVSEDEG